jgi:hypothetical protein
MKTIVCPGIHPPHLTQQCLQDIQTRFSQDFLTNCLIFPTQDYPAYSPFHLLSFLQQQITQDTPLLFLSYSAGVVAAISTAHLWQQQGGQINGFIALDGWGVPLLGNFPIHRLSHDHFTHWSSRFLGAGEDSFYADPPVAHLDLWGSPSGTWGWWETPQQRIYCHAADFLAVLIQRYDNQGKSLPSS